MLRESHTLSSCKVIMSLIIISIIIIYVSYFIIIIIFMIRNSSLFRIRAERDGTLHRGPIRSTRSTWAHWPKGQLRAATATPRRAIRTAAQAAPHVDLRSGASARRPGHLGQGPAAPPPCAVAWTIIHVSVFNGRVTHSGAGKLKGIPQGFDSYLSQNGPPGESE